MEARENAWATCLKAMDGKTITACRSDLECFFHSYPIAPRQWEYWIDKEIKDGQFALVEQLFQRCLIKNLDLELWKLYLRYIRHVNPSSLDTAFAFLLENVGFDLHATPIWRAFIERLKVSSSICKIRSIYQKACQLPILRVDVLWSEYEAWEMSINPHLANALLSQHRTTHVKALRWSRERLAKGEKLSDTRSFLKFIVNNKIASSKKQIVFCYRHALLSSYDCAEIWFDYAMEFAKQGFEDEALAIFQEACTTLPQNTMIHFLYADYMEQRKLFDGALAILNTLSKNDLLEEEQRSLVYCQLMRRTYRYKGKHAARKVFLQARKHCKLHHPYLEAANIEYRLNHEKQIASNIFAYGFQRFSQSRHFVSLYLDFLMSINDETNCRVVLERAMVDFKDNEEIVSRYAEFQRLYGEVKSENLLDRCSMWNLSPSSQSISTPARPDVSKMLPLQGFFFIFLFLTLRVLVLGQIPAALVKIMKSLPHDVPSLDPEKILAFVQTISTHSLKRKGTKFFFVN